MSDDLWIVIPNWKTFQHYRDRDPTWIKNYVRLTADDAYLALSFHARGVLHGIWLEYARTNGQLLGSTSTASRQHLGSTASLSRRLGDRVTRATLQSLNDAGFIELSASRPLALARARARSRETEEETEDPLTPTDVGEPASKNNTRPCRQCGEPVEPGRGCRACGATPRQSGSNSRRSRTPTPYARAEAFVRNAGWRYDEIAFADELDRFQLDPYETSLLEQLREQLLTRTRTPEPALDEEPLF